MTYQTNSTSLEKTEQLAAAVGARLRGGEVIVLSSDLGGGKTAFVRGLARGMGSQDHVASPTFTIAREYHAKKATKPEKLGLSLYHFDFYRLQEPGLVAAELAEVAGDRAAVIAIEWGTIVEDVLPKERLTVRIVPTGENSRDLIFDYPESLSYLISEKS